MRIIKACSAGRGIHRVLSSPLADSRVMWGSAPVREVSEELLKSAVVMYDFTGEKGLDLEVLRTRLRLMSDDALNRFGQAARYMCSPVANHGRKPRRVFVIQLRETVKEWRRRRPI